MASSEEAHILLDKIIEAITILSLIIFTSSKPWMDIKANPEIRFPYQKLLIYREAISYAAAILSTMTPGMKGENCMLVSCPYRKLR